MFECLSEVQCKENIIIIIIMTYFTRILSDVKKYSAEIQNFNVAENKLRYVIDNEVNNVIKIPEYNDDVAE